MKRTTPDGSSRYSTSLSISARFTVSPIRTGYTSTVGVLHPFELHNYTGEAGAYEIASGDLVVPGINAKVVMIKQEDGSVAVTLAAGLQGTSEA